jgi:hypothetical protein
VNVSTSLATDLAQAERVRAALSEDFQTTERISQATETADRKAVSETTVRTECRRLHDEGVLERDGEGVKGSPYTYRLLVEDEDPQDGEDRGSISDDLGFVSRSPEPLLRETNSDGPAAPCGHDEGPHLARPRRVSPLRPLRSACVRERGRQRGGAEGVNLCRSCGCDFASVRAFDAHRAGVHGFTLVEGLAMQPPREDGRRCLDSDEMRGRGLVPDPRGRWSLLADAERARRRFSHAGVALERHVGVGQGSGAE